MIDLFLVYQFIRRLATPFSEWEAFKQGIIDEDGNILIPKKERRLQRQRDAFGVFDLLVLKLKKMLEKLPGGKSRLASYAAVLWLIKEWNHFSNESMLTEEIIDSFESAKLYESNIISLQRYVDYIIENENVKGKNALLENFLSEEPTVSAGSGHIAGIGVGPDGEPGLTPAQMRRYKKKNKKGKPKSLRKILGEKT